MVKTTEPVIPYFLQQVLSLAKILAAPVTHMAMLISTYSIVNTNLPFQIPYPISISNLSISHNHKHIELKRHYMYIYCNDNM